MTLYLFNYNNYYNRLVKKEATINDYLEKAEVVETIPSVNFIRGNGISTSQIVNTNSAVLPDYMVCVNEYGEIDSRWFIVENMNLRQGQYQFSLIRDVVADWYDEIVNAPCFIEKATLGVNDTGIFNNENMLFNQIKTKETPITDITKSAWYVGYLNKEFSTETPIAIPKGTEQIAGTPFNNFEDYPYYAYSRNGSSNFRMASDPTFRINFRNHIGDSYIIGWDANGNPKTPTSTKNFNNTEYGVGGTIIDGLAGSIARNTGYLSAQWTHSATEIAKNVLKTVKDNQVDWSSGIVAAAGCKTQTELMTLQEEVGKIYQIGNGYYQVQVVSGETRREYYAYNNVSTPAAKYRSIITQSGELDINDVNGNGQGFEITTQQYYVDLVPYQIDSLEINIPINRTRCEDSPWDMFCIPYHAVSNYTDNVNWTTSPELSRRVVDAIIRGIPDKVNMYDIQLLPYCPLPDNLLGTRSVDLSLIPNTDTTRYIRLGDQTTNTFIAFCQSANFKRNIYSGTVVLPSDAVEFKVANECDMYRLCSPNYNGQFEFSATKNGGITGYTLSMSCKPYTPYIRLAPIFGRLYGKDYGDARGLICGGDFSLYRLNDAWREYELNNKNYQVMFDRQIQNMEVNNAVQRELEWWNIGFGALAGAGTGAMAGMYGGGKGAAIGAAIGGITSGVGGALDYKLNEKLRAEALDYTKDQFGYQLQNIKAIPTSLTKISALNTDNKLFPILEYYTCSDVEKQALRDKIKYNGMTVMRIGTISQFILPNTPSYIKGRIIRMENLEEDYLVATTIANEINQGVYL